MRWIPEVAFWWAACVGLWLLTLSSVTASELVAAVAAGLPCAVLAVSARRAVRGAWSVRPGWTRWLLPLPVAVLADTARLLGVAAGVLVGRRIPEGDVRRLQLPVDRPPGRWQTRQAAAAGLVTAAPGTVVLDVDEESGTMLLHTLAAGKPQLEEVVRR